MKKIYYLGTCSTSQAIINDQIFAGSEKKTVEALKKAVKEL
jgi:hypothetical protein